jgi:predicted ATP-grasp superfamily ATP-dependent carboligase
MNFQHVKALGSALLSYLAAVFAWISLKDAQVIAAIGGSTMAFIAGAFSARYYWYAAKEKKENLKKIKSNL